MKFKGSVHVITHRQGTDVGLSSRVEGHAFTPKQQKQIWDLKVSRSVKTTTRVQQVEVQLDDNAASIHYQQHVAPCSYTGWWWRSEIPGWHRITCTLDLYAWMISCVFVTELKTSTNQRWSSVWLLQGLLWILTVSVKTWTDSTLNFTGDGFSKFIFIVWHDPSPSDCCTTTSQIPHWRSPGPGLQSPQVSLLTASSSMFLFFKLSITQQQSYFLSEMGVWLEGLEPDWVPSWSHWKAEFRYKSINGPSGRTVQTTGSSC